VLRLGGLGVALAVVAAAVVWPACASPAASSSQAIAFLNAQRAANGIPGDLANDPNLELGCQQHNRYMAANSGLEHSETAGNPYYTPEGAAEGPWQYRSEVLAYEGFDELGRNPWEWAPIHLYLMLDPERTSAGYDSAKYTCMRMGGDREVAFEEPPRFFSYPGPGSRGIYPEEQAYEAPYVPQEIVGIPEGEITGTNIMLFSLGTRGLNAESFQIAGPAGPVAARMVDEDTSNEVGSGGWFHGGGVLIPEQPLAPNTTYSVSVRWRNLAFAEQDGEGGLHSAEFFTQEFDFTTGDKRIREPVEARIPRLALHRLRNRSGAIRFRLGVDQLLAGRSAKLTVYRHEKGCGGPFASRAGPCGWRQLGPPRRSALKLHQSQVLSTRGPQNRWQRVTVKVRTRGFMVGETRILPGLTRAMVWGDR
jgi:hypothetical protein